MSPAKLPALPSRPARGSLPGRLLIALAIWLLATAGAGTAVIRSSLSDAELDFAEYGEHFHAQLRDKLRANEAVLYGFASFLGAVSTDDPRLVTPYARSMLERYPHIYMLEVVRRVPRAEVPGFLQGMRRIVGRDFDIRRFDYSERQWQRRDIKDAYYPIVLAEPDVPQARDILGLDIDSLTGLRGALLRSEKRGVPAASEPFRLVEGDNAYVMFRPAPAPGGGGNRTTGAAGLTYALLVIRAGDLFPPDRERSPFIRHTAYMNVGSGDAAPQILYDQPASSRIRVGENFFPALRIERNIDGVSQPITLVLERRLGLGDISSGAAGLAALASILSLALMLAYIGARERQERSREEAQQAMEHLALHDALTGLPNRFLMLGRLAQALSAAQRHGTRLAVLFLDLDGFKPINDRHGHHIGDEVLKIVATRLRDCVRDCDTVARHGGDEFLVALTDMRGTDDAAAVAVKVLAAVARPVDIGTLTLRVTTSIGIALYPDVASDGEALIRAADAAMYEAKAEGRHIFRFAMPEYPELPGIPAARSTAP